MLCASALAALEAATPSEYRPARDDDESSYRSSEQDGEVSSRSTVTTSTNLSSSASSDVGRVRSERADGTDASYDSVEKWIYAALRSLGKNVSDILLPSLDPNDELVSRVHNLISKWRLEMTTAKEAGVEDPRPHVLKNAPPKCVLAKTRGWFIRHVNSKRRAHYLREVDDNWARKLSGIKGDAREVNRDANQKVPLTVHCFITSTISHPLPNRLLPCALSLSLEMNVSTNPFWRRVRQECQWPSFFQQELVVRN